MRVRGVGRECEALVYRRRVCHGPKRNAGREVSTPGVDAATGPRAPGTPRTALNIRPEGELETLSSQTTNLLSP